VGILERWTVLQTIQEGGEVNQEEILDDIKKVMEKHGLHDGAFCSFTNDGMFFGSLINSDDTVLSLFDSIIAVGRLWQHARNSCRSILSEFEKAWD